MKSGHIWCRIVHIGLIKNAITDFVSNGDPCSVEVTLIRTCPLLGLRHSNGVQHYRLPVSLPNRDFCMIIT